MFKCAEYQFSAQGTVNVAPDENSYTTTSPAHAGDMVELETSWSYIVLHAFSV